MSNVYVSAQAGVLVADYIESDDLDREAPLDRIFYTAPIAWQLQDDHVPIAVCPINGEIRLGPVSAVVLPDGRTINGDGEMFPNVAAWAQTCHSAAKARAAARALKGLA